MMASAMPPATETPPPARLPPPLSSPPPLSLPSSLPSPSPFRPASPPRRPLLLQHRLLLQLGCALALLGGTAGCMSAPDAAPPPEPAAHAAEAPSRGGATSASAAISGRSATSSAAHVPPAASSAATSVDVAAYPWLSDRTCAPQTVTVPLASRFAPPRGLARAPVAPGSFGAWLRGLPLRPSGPVVDYKGRVILEEDDARFAAVAALDEGTADLQQCADSIMRLHAEWLWSKGRRAITYRAASGTPMPFERWLAGERPSAEGLSLVWKPLGRAVDRDDHGAFRRYLDAVFTWANTGALARDAAKPPLDSLRPGDFFVLAGSPGHAVLVLDVATNDRGERAMLLGQGYMPAQSFHVLRPSSGAVWFPVDVAAGGVQTPFWPAPFPWSSLRRLD